MASTEKKRVLIVDDELDMRIFLSTVFETSGFAPVSVRDGKAGLARAKEVGPDLITLDIMMPGEGGVYMYRHLKEDADLSGIPVMILSAVDRKSFFHYLRMLRAKTRKDIPEPDAFLEKPPDPDEILETARNLLESRRARA